MITSELAGEITILQALGQQSLEQQDHNVRGDERRVTPKEELYLQIRLIQSIDSIYSNELTYAKNTRENTDPHPNHRGASQHHGAWTTAAPMFSAFLLVFLPGLQPNTVHQTRT